MRPIPSPQILAREGNKQLVRYATADSIWLEFIVHREDGSWFRGVIHIHVPTRFVEHYIMEWDSNGQTVRREMVDEKVVIRRNLRKILKRALSVQTFADFFDLVSVIREA